MSLRPKLHTSFGPSVGSPSTAIGSFIFDADTVTYSSINVLTTPGSSSAPGAVYGSVVPAAWTSLTRLGSADGPWGDSLPNLLVLGFPNLTNAEGVVNL
jgi:hypothetical protein